MWASSTVGVTVLAAERICARSLARFTATRVGSSSIAKPAPAICVLVVDDEGRVLLGRRAHEPAEGRWDILGGFMNENEQPFDTLRRELREETSLDVEPGTFVGVVTDRYGDDGNATLNLCWTATVVSGDAAPSDDVAELRWFERDELPGEEELAFSNTAELLRAWRTGQ